MTDFGRKGNLTVNIYSRDGAPKRTFPFRQEFSPESLAYNGRYFALRRKTEVAVFDAATGMGVLAFTPEAPADAESEWPGWKPFSVFEGKELWLVNEFTGDVTRFAWPK